MTTLLANFLCWIEQGICFVVNLFIAGLAAAVTGVLSLLPSMPDLPSAPTELTTAASWVAWWLPLGTIGSIFGFITSALLLWLVLGPILRWVRAIR